MGVLDELLSRIFLSLENFFQKATELDVFEDFVFSYKIKLVSVEKCSHQFLTAFAELENELQLAVKECMYLSDGQWELYVDRLLHENVIGDREALDDVPVETSDKTCTDLNIKDSNEKLLSNQQLQHVKHTSDNVINVDGPKQSINDTAVINPIRIISTFPTTNSNQNIINVNNIFKCDFCLRRFRTFLKFTKHSCKKRSDNKAAQQLTINIETNNSTNISASIDDSTTIFVDDDRLQANLEEQVLQLEQPTILSSQSSVQVTQFHDHRNHNHRNSHSMHEEPDLPVYSCTLCCISFLEKAQWDEHVCKEKEGSINCKRGVIATRSLLEEHNRFICGFCLETYRSLSRIMYHLVRCFTGPYNCEVCSNSFTTRRELNYHKKKQHKGIESFFCDECGLGFKLRTSLQKHLINRHENLQGEYHCDIAGCQLVFPKKIFLTRHKINKHRLERKYLCQVCGNKFYNSCSLSSHLESHSDKNQFSCPICSRLLKTKEKLVLHIRTHTGEKPFPCTICGKSFVAKSKLEEHSRRHRGEKRYKCVNCGKLYANSFDLRQHIKRKCSHNNGDVKDLMQVIDKSTVNPAQTKSTKINLIRRTKPLQSQLPDHQITNVIQQTSQQIIDGKDDNNALLPQMPSNNNSNNVTNTGSSNSASSSASNGSEMIIQLDSNNRVIPLQTTAVHVVDYVPYYQSPDPIHIVMPPQTLVLSGYDNINY